MTHNIISFDPSHRSLAHVEDITTSHPYRWLAAGWKDLRQAPMASIGYGALFAIVSYVITIVLIFNELYFLLLPLLGGFFLVAPALGMGLYEISRRLEKDEKPTLAQAIASMNTNRFQVMTLGAFLMVLLTIWMMLAAVIFVGLSSGITPNLENALGYLFSMDNLPMLLVGTFVGGAFALLVFALTAVSVPMLLDRQDIDVMSAMQTSFEACRYNWLPMLLWAFLIVICILFGFATWYVGLAIVFPLIGHATWHAYRDIVKP